MSFLALLGNAYAARQNTRATQAQQQFEDTRESQDDAEKKRLADAQATAAEQAAQQGVADRTFESGLQLPQHWSKMAPQDQYNYLQVRYNNAQKAGDRDAAADTLAQMNSLPRAGNEFADTAYTMQGRLPLAQAQTAWWKQKHGEVMAALQERERAVDETTRAAMGRAQLFANTRLKAAGMSDAAREYIATKTANTRLKVAGMSDDEREYIATETALNVANRMNETQAFNTAMDQYKNASAEWQRQEAGFEKGTPGYVDPGTAPQPQQFTVNMAPPAANVITIQVPNGTGGTVPMQVVNPRPNNSAGALPPIDAQISAARAHNVPTATIRAKLKAAGYPQAQINAKIPLDPLPAGWKGFGQ